MKLTDQRASSERRGARLTKAAGWMRVANRVELALARLQGRLAARDDVPPAHSAMSISKRPHRVVVVGGGFGGLQAVRGLRRAPVDVTLIDRRNFHLFQPLLYQVATGALSAGEIASPLRGILKHQRNARVVLGEVSGFDLEQRRVLLRHGGSGEEGAIGYDTLVVATGAGHAYFGRDDWRPLAPGLKTLEDATAIRARILAAFEAAEIAPDADRKRALLTFAVVGGGPTGVEMAGQIAEIARDTLRRDFRNIDPRAARILLVEAADRVLTGFPERLSARAARALERLGVTPLLDRSVVDLDSRSITVQGRDGGLERISAHTAIWAAGVRASGLAGMLGQATGARIDRAGRVTVESDLTLRGHAEVFALGDMVQVQDPDGQVAPLPGVAPVAMQQGRYAAKLIRARLNGRERKPFRYIDKGNVATIGRLRAVLDLRGVQLSGTLAWLAYLVVHLFYLVGLQNRVLVFIRWTVSFVTRGRGARLITGQDPDAAPATGTHEQIPVRAAA
jgi:NADH dehydrogenase